MKSWENRVLSLASFLEVADCKHLDGLFLALFQYGVLKGLCGYLGEVGTRVRAGLFLDLLLPQVEDLHQVLKKEGVPFPRRDMREVLRLV